MKTNYYLLFLLLGLLILSSCSKDDFLEIENGEGEIENSKKEFKPSQTKKGIMPALETVTDINGHIYHKVKIGTQVWLLENLKVENYQNGDPIQEVKNGTDWVNRRTGAFCWYNNDKINNYSYGALYNWYAVNDPRNIAPKGCHVATKEDWDILIEYLGGVYSAGRALKEAGYEHWIQGNIANNSSGFTALPGGFRSSLDGRFVNLGLCTKFLTSTNKSFAEAYQVYISYQDARLYFGGQDKLTGSSVRCVWDYDVIQPPADKELPTVSTDYPGHYGATWATLLGHVTNDGNSHVTSRGFCWSKTQNPTLANSKKIAGSGTGIYSTTVTGLTPGVRYYIRAFATNSVGTAYGNQIVLIPQDGGPV
jgi:uncharacterized protein (TIGR02145 family)